MLMKRTVLIVILAMCCGLSAFGQTSLTLGQHTYSIYTGAQAASSTLAYGSNVTNGHLLVGYFVWSVGTFSSVTDSQGSWTACGSSYVDTADGFTGAIYYRVSTASAADTVSLNFTGTFTGHTLVAIAEFSGQGASPCDPGIGNNNASSTTWTSTSFTTAANNVMVFGGCNGNNSNTPNSSNFTDIDTHNAFDTAYTNLTTTQSTTLTMTISVASAAVCVISGFKAASQPSGTPRGKPIIFGGLFQTEYYAANTASRRGRQLSIPYGPAISRRFVDAVQPSGGAATRNTPTVQ